LEAKEAPAMTVKASISLTDAQDAFARDLVAQGRFPSLSAVMQHGIELLREQTAASAAEIEALRTLIEERRSGRFVEVHEGRARTRAMIDRKKTSLGL
jgi:antitoxin ParD1/3/4